MILELRAYTYTGFLQDLPSDTLQADLTLVAVHRSIMRVLSKVDKLREETRTTENLLDDWVGRV